MGHGHHHHGESVSGYFTEQLLTILVCLLFGFVAVQLYRTGMLENILAPQFHTWVLVGGVAILVLVAIRAVAVWREAGELQAQAADQGSPTCGLEHDHGPDCDHDPGIGGGHDHAHDHSHSHDMSWTFARMLVLIFPVLLFFLNLPNGSLSAEAQARMLGKDSALGGASLKELAKDAAVKSETKQADGTTVRVLQLKNGREIQETTRAGGGGEPVFAWLGEPARMSFNDMNDAAYDQAKRESLAGQVVILEGKFMRVADKEFTLYRLKMTCCAADTVPLKVRIVVPQSPNNIQDFAWVQVKGQIQFFQAPGGKAGAETFIPVVMVADVTDVQQVPAKNEYE